MSGLTLAVLWASAAWAQEYPPTPGGGGGGGEGAQRVTTGARGAGGLARTGASNTPSLVMIGVAILVTGLVLVLAVRRRRSLAHGGI